MSFAVNANEMISTAGKAGGLKENHRALPQNPALENGLIKEELVAKGGAHIYQWIFGLFNWVYLGYLTTDTYLLYVVMKQMLDNGSAAMGYQPPSLDFWLDLGQLIKKMARADRNKAKKGVNRPGLLHRGGQSTSSSSSGTAASFGPRLSPTAPSFFPLPLFDRKLDMRLENAANIGTYGAMKQRRAELAHQQQEVARRDLKLQRAQLGGAPAEPSPVLRGAAAQVGAQRARINSHDSLSDKLRARTGDLDRDAFWLSGVRDFQAARKIAEGLEVRKEGNMDNVLVLVYQRIKEFHLGR